MCSSIVERPEGVLRGYDREGQLGPGTLADRVAGRTSAVRLPACVTVFVDGVQHPGILLEWSRSGPDWQARVLWATSTSSLHLEVVAAATVSPVPAGNS